MRKFVLSTFILVSTSLFATNCIAKIVFSVQGSNTIGSKLAPLLAENYLKEVLKAKNIRLIKSQIDEEVVIRGFDPKTNIALDIDIKAHGSSTGFKALENGDSEICMSSRPIKDKEIRKLSYLGNFKDFKSEITIGLDGIAVITHKSNPLSSISRKILTDIFSGKIRYWGEVSHVYKNTALKYQKINIYSRDNNSGTYDTFKKLVLVNNSKLSPSAKRYESNARLSDQVASDINGIGFVSLPNIRNSKALSVSEGQGSARAANNLTVATEDYALSRRLYMYISENERNSQVLSFIEYINSMRGQEIVALAGYVSQNIYTTDIKTPDFYPEEYKKLTTGAKRLSVNIHFVKGSLTPDNRAKRDLIRISTYLKNLEQKPENIMLFGFSEDTEFTMFNISLSEARADFVELLLKKQNIIINKIRGFGGIDQVADSSKKDKNRRVEIWIK